MRPWKSCDHQKIFSLLYIFFLFYLLVVGTRTPLKKTKKGEILCDFSKLINIFHVPTGPYYLLDSAMLQPHALLTYHAYIYLQNNQTKIRTDQPRASNFLIMIILVCDVANSMILCLLFLLGFRLHMRYLPGYRTSSQAWAARRGICPTCIYR